MTTCTGEYPGHKGGKEGIRRKRRRSKKCWPGRHMIISESETFECIGGLA